jgi:isoleucyl-tRNA synthetase
LRREGQAREIVHAVQNARRAAGLAVEDRIELGLDGDEQLLAAAGAHLDYLTGETLAVELALGEPSREGFAYAEESEIEGRPLTLALRRAPRR